MRPNPYEAPSANIDTPIRSHHWRLVAVLAVVLTVVAMFATMPLMLTLLAAVYILRWLTPPAEVVPALRA